MAIFGNFKGTTQADFKIGKTGARVHGNSSQPASGAENGDIWLDKANSTIRVLSANAWTSIGSTLTDLNVDSGTLFVDSANDTVSIGSTSSNEKLFVNGSLRLGTNPSIKYSGAYLDLKHSNGTGTVIRIRDNTGNTNPVFKVYSSNNSNEVFKVEGNSITINDYVMPFTDGLTGQAITTDGSGNLSFATLNANPAGSNTQVQFNDSGSFGGSDAFTFDKETSTLQTGVVRGVIFEPITDYGFISDITDMIIDYGSVSDSNSYNGDFEYILETSGVLHDSFRVAGLPNAGVPGQMIYVSDESGGATMAFSDGTNWRRIQDRAIIS